MPRGMFKSRTLRRVSVRVPGGTVVKRYEQRKPSVGHCAITGEVLHGAPRKTPTQLAKLPKTKRRPERPYGGVLGSRASRQVIKEEARETQ